MKAGAETAVDTSNDRLAPSLITNVMRLTPELQPGDYYLQVMFTDKAAKNKKSVVSQWVDFEIVK